MNKEYIEQAIYERTQEFVPQCVYEAILELIATEREACAEVCKKHADVYAKLEQNPTAQSAWAACIDNRDAIRARGNVATNDTSQERVDKTSESVHEPLETIDSLEQEIYENTRQFVSRDVMEWMLKRYYTPPPQRTWVGLTDGDIAEIYNQKDWDIHTNWDYERAIEAKLKEKNT